MPGKKPIPDTDQHEPELRNLQHEMFCRAYIRGMTGTQAAIEAGYSHSNAGPHASRLLARPDVKRRIATLRDMHGLTPRKPAKIDKQWVMESLVRNVENALAANDRASANRGLELLGREYGLFTERRVVQQDPLDGLTAEQLQLLLAVSSSRPMSEVLSIGSALIDVTPVERGYREDNAIHNDNSDLDDHVGSSDTHEAIEAADAGLDAGPGAAAGAPAGGPPVAPTAGAATAAAGGDLETPPTPPLSDATDPAENSGKGHANAAA